MHNITKHHIVPSSQGGRTTKDNIVRLTETVHIALHQLFYNQMPHEQFGRLLDINSTALTESFSHRIKKVLQDDPQYFYKDGVMRPK